MGRLAALVLLGLLAQEQSGAPAGAPTGAGSAPPVRLQLGVRVSPETVTVGDPFTIAVRVRAPRGAVITFAAGPDSGAAVEAVDPRVVRARPDSTAVEQVAVYRLVAWDTGQVRTALGPVVVTGGTATRRIPLAGVAVVVRSVLPADTALRVPKPARDILAAPAPWWRWLLLAAALLALLLLAALLVWLWRRRRRPAAAEDALTRAEREFARVKALGLLEAREPGRYVALHVDVLRDYLAARIPAARRSLTGVELVTALRAAIPARVPLESLEPLVRQADLVKFARLPLSTEQARLLGLEARAIVLESEGRVRAAEAALAAEPEAAA